MLPSQPAAAVHWRNALYASPPWHAEGVEWRWQASPERVARSVVTLHAGDDELQLAFHDDVIASGEAAIDNWADYDEPARSVMWTLAHERLLELLARLFGRDWVVHSVALAPPAPQPQPRDHDDRCAGFVCRTDAMRLSGSATMGEALARAALERHAAAAPAPDAATSVWAQGRVRLACVIDRVPARDSDLAALRVGALVLLDNPTLLAEPVPSRSLGSLPPRPCKGHFVSPGAAPPWERPGGGASHVRLVLGAHELPCELHGSRLLVLNAHATGDMTMIDPLHAATAQADLLDGSTNDAAPDHAPLAAHAPVCLSFEAGSVSLPLAQLAGIREGYTFFLPAGLDHANVRVLANGVPVGSGQLVRIDDVVGVQLTHLDKPR